MDQKFNEIVERVKHLAKKPSDEELLELYALYKQVVSGDNDSEKPGLFKLKDKAKWIAWAKKKGMSRLQAMQAYISKAEELIAKYGS